VDKALAFKKHVEWHSVEGSDQSVEVTNEWLKKGGFLIATSALGPGVDFPGVVYIVHLGIPYRLIDFAQESGRLRVLFTF
jgi:superfamily II DNA helicase RecQ